jgi:hypothetical protein
MKSTVSGTCAFGSQRAEVMNAGTSYKYTNGQERYFADSVYFPTNFPTTQEGHCITMQIHSQEPRMGGKSPVFSLSCRDSAADPTMVMLRTGDSGGCQWQTPMVCGGWHHFVVRMKFSTSSAIGSWDLWYGTGSAPVYKKVASNCPIAALMSSTDFGYYKVGLYRGLKNTEAEPGVRHLRHTSMRQEPNRLS